MNHNSSSLLHVKLDRMIFEYISVGHYEAAMDIIETALVSKRQPSSQIIIALVDIVLHLENRKKLPKRKILEIRQKSQRLLMHMLEIFGPEPFAELWNSFRRFHVFPRRQKTLYTSGDDEDDERQLSGTGLSEYEDFWDFMKQCLVSGAKLDMAMKCRRMTLDIVISVLELDLRLKKDSMGIRSQLQSYLDVLFCAFNHENNGSMTQTSRLEGIDLAGRVLNMLITLSGYDNAVSPNALVDRTYRHFVNLHADDCAHLLQVIRCGTFRASLCDMAIADADGSCVEKPYRHYRKNMNSTMRMEKLFHYVMKTQPSSLKNIEDIYRHVLVVLWYLDSLMDEYGLRYDLSNDHEPNTKIISTLPEDQLLQVIEYGLAATDEWRLHVRYMIQKVPPNTVVEKKIESTMYILLLHINMF
ncbi:hypothetical protein DFQ29_009542 [Apophysomyces sp. BC1021]|nr:hypothetical protein DFQ29_009542 [Apophysomyces sp. BC1021]